MSKKKTLEGDIKSKIDVNRQAKNADNGFKTNISAGTKGIGDNRKR